MIHAIQRSGETVSVAFSGLLTFHSRETSEKLLADINDQLKAGGNSRLDLDLAGVEALDSLWLGVFVRLYRRSREFDVHMRILKPRPEVRRLFQVVELDRIFEVCD